MKLINILIILSILGLLFIPKERINWIQNYSLGAFVLIFLSSICIFILGTDVTDIRLEPVELPSLEFAFLLDGLSGSFVVLTTFLFIFCVLVSFSIRYQAKQFFFLLFVSEILIVNAFTVSSLLFFYILFEAVLVPVFLLIGIYGSRKEKVSAAYQLFIYTLAGSTLFLLTLAIMFATVGSFDYLILKENQFPFPLECLFFISFFIALAVKIPMFPFYIWLPKAHVEAPTAGSVLLAGVLLKLGGYGILRFLFLFPDAARYFSPLVILLSLLGIIFSVLAALRQVDIKRIVAYSSIAHLNYANLGLFALSPTGVMGSFTMMIFHGLVSSALFLAVGILYERYKTRNILYYRNLVSVMPLFALFLFILTMGNIGFPGTANFISEILIFMGTFEVNWLAAVMSASSLFFSALSGFWVMTRILYGNYNLWASIGQSPLRYYADLSRRETLILLPFVILLILFGICPGLVIQFCEMSVYMVLPMDDTWVANSEVMWREYSHSYPQDLPQDLGDIKRESPFYLTQEQVNRMAETLRRARENPELQDTEVIWGLTCRQVEEMVKAYLDEQNNKPN